MPVSGLCVSRSTVELAAAMETVMLCTVSEHILARSSARMTELEETVIRCSFLLFVSDSPVSRNRHEMSHIQILAGDGV